MSGRREWEVRLARAWVDLYTRNAPSQDAFDRRAEVASDVHEHIETARAAGQTEQHAARAIGARALRGIPADVAWRVEVEQAPGRLTWHVDHPATVLGLSLLVFFPLGVAADFLRRGAHDWRAAGIFGLAIVLANIGVCAFGIVSLARYRTHHEAGEPLTARRIRRILLCVLSLCWALSGLCRFAPAPLDTLASLAWLAFGLTLIAYAFTLVGSGLTRLWGGSGRVHA